MGVGDIMPQYITVAKTTAFFFFKPSSLFSVHIETHQIVMATFKLVLLAVILTVIPCSLLFSHCLILGSQGMHPVDLIYKI